MSEQEKKDQKERDLNMLREVEQSLQQNIDESVFESEVTDAEAVTPVEDVKKIYNHVADVNMSVGYESKKLKKEYNVIDGYRILEREELPFRGVFYPESWQFAYRCPTTQEVANFSTIQDNDQPKIVGATIDLIKKCFTIIDREHQREISPKYINDGERLFFFLKLREFYLNDAPIEYLTVSSESDEPVTVNFVADSLIYKQPNPALLEFYDGRLFNIPVGGTELTIKFLMPTLDTTEKIYRYLSKTYKEASKENNDGLKEREAFNRKFILILPFLYESGSETVESLKMKFKQIEKNDVLLDAYLNLVNQISLSNSENIRFTVGESGVWEETPMKFPNGWKSLFINKTHFGNIFS